MGVQLTENKCLHPFFLISLFLLEGSFDVIPGRGAKNLATSAFPSKNEYSALRLVGAGQLTTL